MSAGCDNCLDADTLVLYRDWTWRRLSDVQTGDELLGFVENGGNNRKLEISVVENVWRTRAEAARITTPDSEIVASVDHRFLSGVTPRWQQTNAMTLRRSVLRYIPHNEMWDLPGDYRCGYIAGAVGGLGEGNGDGRRFAQICVQDTQQVVLDRCRSFFDDLGIIEGVTQRSVRNNKHMVSVRIQSANPRLDIYDDVLAERPSVDYARGWLAGIFDVEGAAGSSRPNSLRIGNTSVLSRLEQVVRYGQVFGFDFRVERFRNYTSTARLYGTATNRGWFFGWVQPVSAETDACLGSKIEWQQSPVTKIETLGPRDLIDIQTSTRTFFANGYATHNCYAEELMDHRYKRVVWGPGNPRQTTSDKYWRQPVRWNAAAAKAQEPQRVFCASLADVFDPHAPDGAREQLWELIAETPWLQWLLLTKRPANLTRMLPDGFNALSWPNVWLGMSAEDQDTYDKRWGQLDAVSATVRFVSYEPAIGPVRLNGTKPDWVIIGGESGSNARPMDPQWVTDMVDDCVDADVPTFFKQWGSYGNNPLTHAGAALNDVQQLDPKTNGKGGALLNNRLWRQSPVVEQPQPVTASNKEPAAPQTTNT